MVRQTVLCDWCPYMIGGRQYNISLWETRREHKGGKWDVEVNKGSSDVTIRSQWVWKALSWLRCWVIGCWRTIWGPYPWYGGGSNGWFSRGHAMPVTLMDDNKYVSYFMIINCLAYSLSTERHLWTIDKCTKNAGIYDGQLLCPHAVCTETFHSKW